MNTLSEQQILAQLRALDPFSRQEVLDFMAFLQQRRKQSAAPETPDFDQASEYVLKKNAELYKRLA